MRLNDPGQYTGYTTTFGEDADYLINPMSFTDNGNGTVTDNNTGLIWQKTDGGEMTFAAAQLYCQNLSLAGFNDWRLPTDHELMSINWLERNNPALDTNYFTKTAAEYWYTSLLSANDTSKVWVVNAGGGIGPHPKSETVSAGGTKLFHVRAVRDPFTTVFSSVRFVNNGNGTVSDTYTGLMWERSPVSTTMTWEDALTFANALSLGGFSDWRLPDQKELQSLNDVQHYQPSVDTVFFKGIQNATYWSSSTLKSAQPTRAWDMNLSFGIVSYDDKTTLQHVWCVRGGTDNSYLGIQEVPIPSGIYDMGDHYGFVDPNHPGDETPIHTVLVDSFNICNTEATNQQFLAFLNSEYIAGHLTVQDSVVYASGDTNIYCYLNHLASYTAFASTEIIFRSLIFDRIIRWSGCVGSALRPSATG